MVGVVGRVAVDVVADVDNGVGVCGGDEGVGKGGNQAGCDEVTEVEESRRVH